ncbi:unnamed protein product [Rotaria sordida]|uniref:C2H2-type domain-containing protein n=1 Tax=Rotaria sordida TaxID=392033 RepID=A0A815I326_9BILA|nr:unnamed protein product [Rotaria sordida]
MQYYKYTTEYFSRFSVLHESTLFKILAECKASTRRAVSGLNYFAANGSEAFDNIIELINGLTLDTSERHRLVNNIKKGKQYLKTNFKANVARTSRVFDHCICFSLSDPTSNSFSAACSDHEHDQVCSECLYLAQALQDTKQAIENSKDKEEEVKRKMHKFTLAYDAIQAWKSHQLRSINQDLGRESVLDVLGEDAIYLNLDFAMNPRVHCDQEQDEFMVGNRKQTLLEEDDEEESESGCNSEKVHDSSIGQACIRCDDAGCYHSAYTVLSMPAVSEKCGIAVRRMDFADPQGGKGSSDRYAAIIKSHVRRYLNEKHDVINAEQFVEACLSYGGKVIIGSLDLIKPSPEIIFGSSVNNNLSGSIDVNLSGECTESVNEATNLFECPEETCVSSFVKYGNLLRHLAVGNHRHMPEKESLKDDIAVHEAIERITFLKKTNEIPETASKEKRPLSLIQNEPSTPKRSTTSHNQKY